MVKPTHRADDAPTARERFLKWWYWHNDTVGITAAVFVGLVVFAAGAFTGLYSWTTFGVAGGGTLASSAAFYGFITLLTGTWRQS